MALLGTVNELREQLVRSPRFAVALDYLERVFTPGSAEHTRVMAVPVGEMERVPLGDGVFALEQAYVGKPLAAGRWEAHDGHIDLQAIVAGPERIDVCARAGLAEEENLLAEKDVVFLRDGDLCSTWKVAEGAVAVFFTTDAHKPSLAVDEPVVIHKTCVKVAV